VPVRARKGRAPALVLSPDPAAAEAARAVLRFYLRAFAREAPGARAGEVEPVHQLRVATRRMRAALRLFAPVLPPAMVARTRRDLRVLGRSIGAVRDLDVLAQAVASRSRRLDPELREALDPLEQTIRERRKAAHAGLRAALDAVGGRRLLAPLEGAGGGAPGARRDVRLGDLAADLVAPLLHAGIRAGRRIEREAPAEAFHRLRVRLKRLRYALETLRGLGRKRLAMALERLERLQDFLGAHQDAVTQVAWLRAYAESADVPRATVLAVGALVQVLGRRARRRRRRFPDAWTRFDRRSLRRGLLAEIATRRRRAPGLRLVRRAAS
jgi:triphosphatase